MDVHLCACYSSKSTVERECHLLLVINTHTCISNLWAHAQGREQRLHTGLLQVLPLMCSRNLQNMWWFLPQLPSSTAPSALICSDSGILMFLKHLPTESSSFLTLGIPHLTWHFCGTNGESSIEMYRLPYVKQMGGVKLYNTGSSI